MFLLHCAISVKPFSQQLSVFAQSVFALHHQQLVACSHSAFFTASALLHSPLCKARHALGKSTLVPLLQCILTDHCWTVDANLVVCSKHCTTWSMALLRCPMNFCCSNFPSRKRTHLFCRSCLADHDCK